MLRRGIGVCLNYLSLLTERIAPRPVGYVTIESTRICNLRCRMCNIGAMSTSPEFRSAELKPSTWADVFRGSRFLKLMPKVRVTGGEPFIRKDLPDLVSSLLCIPHIEEVAVYTNGYLTDRIITGVKRILAACPSNKRLEIGVSLDHIGRKHDEIRGVVGVFERVCATLEGLRKLREQFSNLRIGSASVVQPENVFHIEDIDKLRRAMGVESHYIVVQNTSFLGNRDEPYGAQSFTEEQKSEICWLARENDEMIGVRKWLEMGARPMRCFAGTSSLFIASNGDLYPCVAMGYAPRFLMGNLAAGNFDEIWTSRQAWEVRRRVKQCTFSSCWAGCEITATRVQHAPLELGIKYASLGLLHYYRLRGLR